MENFFYRQLDYIYFIYGLSFFILSLTIFFHYKIKKDQVVWKYLGFFTLIHGFNEWLDLINISFGENYLFGFFRWVVLVLSFVFLIELGRNYTRKDNKLIVGVWVYFVLFGLIAVLGWVNGGFPAVKIFSRYFLGVFGCLWASAAIYKFYIKNKLTNPEEKKCLIFLSGFLLFYGLSQIFVAKAKFFPAIYINQTFFLEKTGVPIQLIRTLFVLGATYIVWQYHYKQEIPYDNKKSKQWSFESLFLVLFVFIVFLGGIITYFVGVAVDNKERRNILDKAKLIVSSVNIEAVKQFSGNKDDIELPAYKDFSRRLLQFGNSQQDIRYLYVMGMRNKEVIYYVDVVVDKYKTDSINEVGEVYPEATEKLKMSFINEQPFVEGPVKDEWGTWISALVPLKDSSGNIIAVFGMDVDAHDFYGITLRARFLSIFIFMLFVVILIIFFFENEKSKLTRELILRSYQKLQELHDIISRSQTIVFLWRNEEGWPIEYVSENISLFGFKAQELYYKKVCYVDIIYLEDLERIRQEVEHYAKLQVNEFLQEYRIVTADGDLRWVEDFCWVRKNAEGKITHYQGVIQDITGRKHAEQELRDAKRNAEIANQAKSDFLANMSHEIRTPMNAVIGLVEILDSMALSKEQRNIVDSIFQETTALINIVNKILDFSKIESKKLELDVSAFNLPLLISNVKEIFIKKAKLKGLKFNCEIDDEVPSMIEGDFTKIKQIINNLLDNAFKFTQKGFIKLLVHFSDETQEEIILQFMVVDSGIGIALDKQATIFESFKQADSSITRKYGGTGLGTAISKKLAEFMGGKIGFESQENHGSCFWVEIPFKKTKTQKSKTQEAVPTNEIPILLIGIRQIRIYDLLRSWGFKIIGTDSLFNSLELLHNNFITEKPISIIIVDSEIVREDGGISVIELKKVGVIKDIPIVAFDILGDNGIKEICEKLGLYYCFCKPLQYGNLLGFLKDVYHKNYKSKNITISFCPRKNSQIKILLAEDYPVNRQIVYKHLTDHGFVVDTVEDGREAVEKFKHKQYDLILMDVQMPVMDGFQAVEKIREIEQSKNVLDRKRIPIIALTAHVVKEYIERCLLSGMDDYLSKPFRKQDLLNMVDKWIIGVFYENSGDVATAESEEEKIIDFKKALSDFNDDEKFFMGILSQFLEDVEKRMGVLKKALMALNAQEIRKHAHSIKGGAGNLTAFELASIAHEIEEAALNKEFDVMLELIPKFEEAFMRLKDYISQEKGVLK